MQVEYRALVPEARVGWPRKPHVDARRVKAKPDPDSFQHGLFADPATHESVLRGSAYEPKHGLGLFGMQYHFAKRFDVFDTIGLLNIAADFGIQSEGQQRTGGGMRHVEVHDG